MSSFPHLAVCLKGCVSERLSVSWKDCLSLWRTVCLVKGLSVFWKDCLSGELSVSRENFLSLGRTVCLFVQRISSLSERLSLKDSLSVSPSPWRIFCLSEKLSASLKDCLSISLSAASVCLYGFFLSVYPPVFACMSVNRSELLCLPLLGIPAMSVRLWLSLNTVELQAANTSPQQPVFQHTKSFQVKSLHWKPLVSDRDHF